jgi:DNA-binding NarL/FixJ family response regulator
MNARTLHLFVSRGDAPAPRWLEAFPALRHAAPEGVDDAADADRFLWVLAEPGFEDWLAEYLRGHPGAPAVVLSLQPRHEEARRAFNVGARGYCHAMATPAMLTQVALVVGNGGLWIGAELMQALLDVAARALPEAPAERRSSVLDLLTPREQAVAEEVARGATNKEIARILGITERTVKAHLGAAFDKLGVRDRLGLALRLKEVPVAREYAA